METTVEQEQLLTSATITPVKSSKMVIIDHVCSSLKVFLILGTSLFSSPLQYRRYQDFYISSNSEYDLETEIYQKLLTISNELYIPAQTLLYGTYQLKLSVTIIESSAYVKITRSNITTSLVELGTSMITHGYEQDLCLMNIRSG